MLTPPVRSIYAELRTVHSRPRAALETSFYAVTVVAVALARSLLSLV